ncbi:helix-turn-helix domain-containing protein [Levilactobacillus yiduensis]|uniref:helix-turn-helix domain-containing protein n=1 Tax=Levilactobacillus yiduensis TaxID=2953880 RepID=UPI0021578E42|nr:helix-turn-helix domain-containing protein [Levilactobacillus yiduensis]
MTTYQYIQQAAKERNTSIRQIEIALGFSNGTLRKWKNNAPTDKLTRVATYLRVDPVDLMFGPTKSSNETKVAKDVIDSLGKNLVEHLIQLDDIHKQRVFAYTQAQLEDQNSIETLAAHQADPNHRITPDEAKHISKILDSFIDDYEKKNK